MAAAAASSLRQICSNTHYQFLFLRTFSSKIFVKGLAFSTTEEKLAETFSQYGSVLNVNIVLNKAKTRSKGFGYVTFATEEEALKAQIGMDRKILHGRVLYVDMQPPRKQKIYLSEQGMPEDMTLTLHQLQPERKAVGANFLGLAKGTARGGAPNAKIAVY